MHKLLSLYRKAEIWEEYKIQVKIDQQFMTNSFSSLTDNLEADKPKDRKPASNTLQSKIVY